MSDVTVRPPQRSHSLAVGANHLPTALTDASQSSSWFAGSRVNFSFSKFFDIHSVVGVARQAEMHFTGQPTTVSFTNSPGMKKSPDAMSDEKEATMSGHAPSAALWMPGNIADASGPTLTCLPLCA
mmetsp:Transcript_11142/g.30786  ORF Transcript_11142/g.30786 Transcript_11142/m.30786 type:complete len:126 (+) Transcript_11142:178-555(+)